MDLDSVTLGIAFEDGSWYGNTFVVESENFNDAIKRAELKAYDRHCFIDHIVHIWCMSVENIRMGLK